MLKRLLGRVGQRRDTEPVTVVSGLPRSGTSMLMKMLESGGMPVLTDNVRTADDDNPKGYYEFERVKALDKGDAAWVPQARGRAVKVVSALLKYLPSDQKYRVVFVHRRMDEILASQRRMLENRGEPTDAVSDADLAALFRKHLADVEAWLRRQPQFETLFVDYNAIVADPEPHVQRLSRFLGHLDTAAMMRVVDPSLYRQRRES